MFGMGASELMIILVIILLLFGASKLPELGRSLGSGLSNFKKGLKDGDELPPEPKVAVRVEEPAKPRLDPPAPAPEPPSDTKDS
jgi:sec-independent protein translocase protein TatA